MPSKKKKYNARFPAGRIKKIMQTDEEVGKVAKAVPVIISRTLELFVESLIKKSVQITIMKNARTLSPHHMKLCILSESRFDFLRELVKSVPEVSSCDDDLSSFGDTPSVSVQLPEGRRSSRDSGGRSTTQEMDIPEQEQPQRQAAPPPQPLPQPPPPSHGLNFYTERDISVVADPAPPILNNDFPARGNPPSYSSNHRSKSLSDNSYDYQSSLINPRGRYSRSHSTNSRDDSIREDYNT